MSIAAMPARYWERKAEEARAKAKTMANTEAREIMRDVARRYKLMASIASKRAAGTGAHATAEREDGVQPLS
jgi:hypothetical protein